jgi:Pirin-related protein
MITIIDAQQRYHNNYGWNETYRLFPSASIHELGNTNFGNTLIFNEYMFQPKFGYDMHPHQNLEQIFIVMEGELTHHDSLENSLVLKKNHVQRITAGSGYARSIYNKGTRLARYIGAWLIPKTQNTHPAHDVREYDPQLWHNALYPVASDLRHGDNAGPPPITINAAATLYRAAIDNAELSFPVAANEKALLYIVEGELDCNGTVLKAGFHVRVAGNESLRLRSDTKAECVLVHMRTEM